MGIVSLLFQQNTLGLIQPLRFSIIIINWFLTTILHGKLYIRSQNWYNEKCEHCP